MFLMILCPILICASFLLLESYVPTSKWKRLDLQFIRNLPPNTKLLAWIDVNATVDNDGYYYLPAGFEASVGWGPVTFAPDINQSGLFWCLTELQAGEVENLTMKPWVFRVWRFRLGELGDLASSNPKLGWGVQEAVYRALQCDGSLQIIVWMEGSSGSIVQNIKTTITEAGGRLLRDQYYDSDVTILTELPAKSIEEVSANPLVKELLLNGPVRYD